MKEKIVKTKKISEATLTLLENKIRKEFVEIDNEIRRNKRNIKELAEKQRKLKITRNELSRLIDTLKNK